MFRTKRIIYVQDYKEMNKHIMYCRKNRLEAPTEEWAAKQRIPKLYYTFDIKYTRIILRYAGNGNPYTEYIFQLDGSKKAQQMNGLIAYNLLQRLSHKGVDDLTGNWEYYDKQTDEWSVGHIAGLIWFNPKYDGQRIEGCIEYDINNSYSYAMLGDIPNTKKKPRLKNYVGKGEIGFRLDKRGFTDDIFLYAIFEEGKYADYIFEAIPSPFATFVKYYYERRKNAKSDKEKEKIKQILNYSIGYLARKNPFLHSTILSRARYRIEDLIDLNTTLYSNTDSLVSMVRRPDIEEMLGHEVGQFKINHTGSFAYNGSGYQWNKELPSIRGKSKEWFKQAYPNGFDILNDQLPFIEANKYYYDREEGIIKCQK